MIPSDPIAEWRTHTRWATDEQVEQDLVLSRALASIFEDAGLARTLALSGGTAFHKLYFSPARRYSEDIDLVQLQRRKLEFDDAKGLVPSTRLAMRTGALLCPRCRKGSRTSCFRCSIERRDRNSSQKFRAKLPPKHRFFDRRRDLATLRGPRQRSKSRQDLLDHRAQLGFLRSRLDHGPPAFPARPVARRAEARAGARCAADLPIRVGDPSCRSAEAEGRDEHARALHGTTTRVLPRRFALVERWRAPSARASWSPAPASSSPSARARGKCSSPMRSAAMPSSPAPSHCRKPLKCRGRPGIGQR